DVVVYGVSVVSRLKPEFLRDMTSFTGGRLFEIEKSANLAQTFLGILEEFRHRYLVSYTPAGVAKDGWHKLDVRVRNRRATVKARPGYLAGSEAGRGRAAVTSSENSARRAVRRSLRPASRAWPRAAASSHR